MEVKIILVCFHDGLQSTDSSLGVFWKAVTAKILHGDNENSDQTDCTYAQAELRASNAHVNRYVFSRSDSC